MGEPLFSSHMLDLSEEPDEENISICAMYFKRMMPMKLILEMEIGITGGVEDGVDNSGVSKEKLYSTPEDVFKAGNVKLQPELLGNFQTFAGEKLGTAKPLFF